MKMVAGLRPAALAGSLWDKYRSFHSRFNLSPMYTTVACIVESKAAAVVIQSIGAHSRLLELERNNKEWDELEAQIADLEEKVRRRWQTQNA